MRLWSKTWQCFQDDKIRILTLCVFFLIVPWLALEIWGSWVVRDTHLVEDIFQRLAIGYTVCFLLSTYGIYSIVYSFQAVYFNTPFGILFPGTFIRYSLPTLLLGVLTIWTVKIIFPLAMILSLCIIMMPALQLVFHMKVLESFMASFNSRYCPENRFAAYLHAVSLGAILYVSIIFTTQGLDYGLGLLDHLPLRFELLTWQPLFGGYLGYFISALIRITVIALSAVAVFGATSILLCYFKTRRMDIKI